MAGRRASPRSTPLGRAGIPVYAVDWRRDAPGFKSRYRAHASPRRLDDKAGFIRFHANLGDTLPAAAPIFALDEDDRNAIARNRAKLGDRFLYPFPPWETLHGRPEPDWLPLETSS